ncbi:hypothetical protein, partial [Mycoplasma phocimorsus]|uniref:hypothetical protein n=1 Tax=Mycoplasma phocimorsus TaxID=3045839 RepID=UPI0024BF7778
ENGESQEAINAEQLYPILKSDGWAEKEKARTAIDWAATVAQAGLTIAEAAANNGEEKHYKTAWKAVGIANKLFQIVLGGTIDSNILRDIKDEAASIAYDYAENHWHFIKGAEILADIMLDMQEFIMQKSRDAHKESAFNASWSTRDKLWKIEQYEAQKKEEFAQRNFKQLTAWLFAMFYHNDKDESGIQKYIKENGEEGKKGVNNNYKLWSWYYNIMSPNSKIKKFNSKKGEEEEEKEKFKDKKWQLVKWKFEDFIWNENNSKDKTKQRKFGVLKSIAAKNGLFDSVIKTIKLISSWDNKSPDSRAQELVNITVGVTAAIAKIVKSLKKTN